MHCECYCDPLLSLPHFCVHLKTILYQTSSFKPETQLNTSGQKSVFCQSWRSEHAQNLTTDRRLVTLLVICPQMVTYPIQRRATSLGWRFGVVVNVLVLINEVNLRRARLVLGWVTICGVQLLGWENLSQYITSHSG